MFSSKYIFLEILISDPLFHKFQSSITVLQKVNLFSTFQALLWEVRRGKTYQRALEWEKNEAEISYRKRNIILRGLIDEHKYIVYFKISLIILYLYASHAYRTWNKITVRMLIFKAPRIKSTAPT
jgi:hypothetical protein